MLCEYLYVLNCENKNSNKICVKRILIYENPLHSEDYVTFNRDTYIKIKYANSAKFDLLKLQL